MKMKEPSKHMLNGIIIVLVAIIIAITFTINYSSSDKSSTHCYKKVYAMGLISNKERYKTEVKIEGESAVRAGVVCLKK